MVNKRPDLTMRIVLIGIKIDRDHVMIGDADSGRSVVVSGV